MEHQKARPDPDPTDCNISAGFDIYDIIRHSKAPITGIVFVQANSMAIAVLQACKIRQALKHAIFTFHNLEMGIKEEWQKLEEEAKKRSIEGQRKQEEYNRIVGERIKGDGAKTLPLTEIDPPLLI